MDEKIENLQSSLNTLQERNRQIRITAGLSLPDISYGVGGPASYTTSSLIEPPELRQTELNLEILETGVQHLLYNTAELEEVISSKILEISHFPSISPVKGGWISSSFGKRIDPFTVSTEDHPGIDISIKPESEVFASAAGVVIAVNNKAIKNMGYGKYILIDHGYGYQTLYAHLSKIYAKEGQQVKRWDLIALTGSKGKSTAPHLHYGVLVDGEPKNPSNFILN
ncbi:M23 family metallopeptidase [bacterium]|nr:M23 family metallopeptidase [bacterium]